MEVGINAHVNTNVATIHPHYLLKWNLLVYFLESRLDKRRGSQCIMSHKWIKAVFRFSIIIISSWILQLS